MSDRPLRILAVTHEAIRNGAPMVAVQVLQWLQSESGYEIETLVLSDGPLVRDFARIGPTHVVALNDPDEMLVAWRDEPEPSVAKIRSFAELEQARVEALRPEAAHLTGFDVLYLNSATSARALRILPEVPPVVVAHIHELDGAYNHWFEPEDRAALMRTDPSYVVVGNRVGQNLVEAHGVDPERITVVRNEFARPTAPPDVEVTRLRARLGLTGDEVVIGAMGAAEWRKGPDLFVQMAAVVSRRLPDTNLQFYWVGRTDDYNLRQYETDAARLGLGDRLRFVGEQSDAASWLRVFDLFCLTSREDPFPLVCLEAGALGVPVISFDNGGMAELTAEAGGTEPLIEIIDYLDVEDMADAVAMRIQDPARRARDGQRLQSWLDEHLFVTGSVGRIAEVIEDRVATARDRSGRATA